jgi:hypothetical protein
MSTKNTPLPELDWDDKQETQKVMDGELLIELKNLISRLKEILGTIKIEPIFEVRPEDESLLERSEND